MWETIKDYLPPATIVGIGAGLLRWRPRRIVGFILAVWNREALLANANDWMAEAQRQEEWGKRWLRQNEECQKEVSRLDTEITRLRSRLAASDDSGDGGR